MLNEKSQFRTPALGLHVTFLKHGSEESLEQLRPRESCKGWARTRSEVEVTLCPAHVSRPKAELWQCTGPNTCTRTETHRMTSEYYAHARNITLAYTRHVGTHGRTRGKTCAHCEHTGAYRTILRTRAHGATRRQARLEGWGAGHAGALPPVSVGKPRETGTFIITAVGSLHPK